MYDLGKQYWDPDPQTFRRLPVFVPTHRATDAVADPGGSTFAFVTDGVGGRGRGWWRMRA